MRRCAVCRCASRCRFFTIIHQTQHVVIQQNSLSCNGILGLVEEYAYLTRYTMYNYKRHARHPGEFVNNVIVIKTANNSLLVNSINILFIFKYGSFAAKMSR